MLTSHVQFNDILKNWQKRELNQWPLADWASALPTELSGHHKGSNAFYAIATW